MFDGRDLLVLFGEGWGLHLRSERWQEDGSEPVCDVTARVSLIGEDTMASVLLTSSQARQVAAALTDWVDETGRVVVERERAAVVRYLRDSANGLGDRALADHIEAGRHLGKR